jgi:RHS repeat-associated protein
VVCAAGSPKNGQERKPERPSHRKSDRPDIDSPFNPYRYSAKRLDSGSRTYDMGARRFDRSAQRFLQLDQFQGALDDLDLATNKYPQSSLTSLQPI